MKKFSLFLLFSLLIIGTNAQGYKISVISDLMTDTLKILSYNKTTLKYETFQTQKYEKEIIFKGQQPLQPGIYIVQKDTTILVEFFISDLKNQEFTITLKDNQATFKGSPENSANRTYIKKMQEFDTQIQKLDDEFTALKNGNLPNYMLQPYVDTLALKAEKIQKQRMDYQYNTVQQYKGTLFASVVKSTMEIPTPPKEYYNNKTTYFTYIAQRHFENYVWADDRLLNTPIPNNKYKYFSQVILQLEPEVVTPIIIDYLDKSKVSIPQYYAFFDYLELFFGSLTSPYRDEYLYIEMLKNALTFPQLEVSRRTRYEYELGMINKNLKGSILPNFPLLMKSGDTTSLYDIQAEYLILYFQNPDCPSCIELRNKMESMDNLKRAITSQKVKIVTIFFEADDKIWRNYLRASANPAYLHGWNYNLQIVNEKMFDTRTIPMLILVDKDKRVIKKDLMSNEIEQYMKMINP